MKHEMIKCIFHNKVSCLMIDAVYGKTTLLYDGYCQKRCGPTDADKKQMLKRHGIELDEIPKSIEELKAKIGSGEIKVMPRHQPPKPVYTEKILPAKLQMAKNLTETGIEVLKKALTEGRVLCCAEQVDERTAICRTCEHREFINEHERCVSFKGGEPGCGCYLEAKRRLAGARCDLGKWDEVDAKYELPDSKDAKQ